MWVVLRIPWVLIKPSAYIIIHHKGSKFATVKRELHFQCTEPKDENGDGAGQPFSTGPHDQGRRLLDDLKLPPTLTGGVVCEKSNTISTSIGRKLLRTFPRRFGKVQWINLKKEAQFRCFLGYQRQLFGYVTLHIGTYWTITLTLNPTFVLVVLPNSKMSE